MRGALAGWTTATACGAVPGAKPCKCITNFAVGKNNCELIADRKLRTAQQQQGPHPTGALQFSPSEMRMNLRVNGAQGYKHS